MKYLITLALSTLAVGIVFTIGCVIYYRSPIPPERLPEHLISSVSPDNKWLCELVDIHPNPNVTLVLVHGAPFEGRKAMSRGYYGETFVTDLDSNGLPENLVFGWEGDTVTISNLEEYPIVVKCAKRATTVTAQAETR